MMIISTAMTKDLFDKRSDRQKLIDWVLGRKYVKTSEVIAESFNRGWPVNRAVRNVQDYAQKHQDKVHRLTEAEVDRMFGIHEGVWEIIK